MSQYRIYFFGGKLDKQYIDTDELLPEYRVSLEEPKFTPWLVNGKVPKTVKTGMYFLKDIWRNNAPTVYKYVYQDDIDRFNQIYG